jgi:hypothetical protein
MHDTGANEKLLPSIRAKHETPLLLSKSAPSKWAI